MRLVMNLAHWQLFRLLSALGLSLSAVSFFVFTVGLVLLPADVERLSRPLYVSVTHSHVLAGSERAVSAAWYMPRGDNQGWRHCLVSHSLSGERPALNVLCPELNPSAMAPGPRPENLVVACWDGSLWQVNLSQPQQPAKKIGKHVELAPHLVACSRDGKWLAALGPHRVCVFDLEQGRLAWTHDNRAICLAFHPDSQRMLIAQQDGALVEVDVASGRTQRQVTQLDNNVINATFSPDGRRVALIASGGSSHLLDWETGKSAWPAGWRDVPHLCRASIVCFSPSGERLIVGGYDTNEMVIWNLRTMRIEGELRGHVKSINGVTFLDEQRLCSFGADGTFRIWDLNTRQPLRVQTLDVTAQAG